MTSVWIIALRIVHIVAGSFWLGALLLIGGFVIPGARAAGPAGGQVVKQIVQIRRLPAYMDSSVYLSLASGFLLFWRASAGFSPAWMATRYGMGWTVGGLLGLAAGVYGKFVNSPTARRIGQLSLQLEAAGGPPPAEAVAAIRGLQGRLFRAVWIDAALVALAAVAMATARYLA